MEALAIVRAVDRSGKIFFATGRAGDGWVSADRAEAFTGFNLQGARRFAAQQNKFEALHGLWFIALPVEVADHAGPCPVCLDVACEVKSAECGK